MEKHVHVDHVKNFVLKYIYFSTLSNEELLKIVNMTEHKSFKENDVYVEKEKNQISFS